MSARHVKVAVTGAAGQIGYALLFRIGAGEMFGPDTSVDLQLLELEQALPALDGVRMELDDCAFPALSRVVTTADADEAFADADWVLLVGAVPRKAGMERKDLLGINAGIFRQQGAAIGRSAASAARVLVVGNPCNTNCMVAAESSGRDARDRWFAMTMLDENRGRSQLAQRAGVPVSEVIDLAVWGNHSATQFPDFVHARIGGRPAPEVISDHEWLRGEFLSTVQQRGAAIIAARGASSAASAANAVIDTVREIDRPSGRIFSAAVPSPGGGEGYDVPEGIVFGFPLRGTNGGGVEIVQGIEHDEWAQERIRATLDELLEERDAVRELLTT